MAELRFLFWTTAAPRRRWLNKAYLWLRLPP
jgi:hypothetical protein